MKMHMYRNTLRNSAVAAAFLVLATPVLAAGCSSERPGGTAASPSATPLPPPATGGPSASATPAPGGTGDPLPTLGPPSGPPKTPSDPYPAGILVGRIVKASDGPCYTMENDEGAVFAVHNTNAGSLAAGTTVRVTSAPTSKRYGCGAGQPVHASRIEVIR